MIPKTPRPVCAGLALSLCLLLEPAFAQALPDAGTLSRESERSLQAPRSAEPLAPAIVVRPLTEDVKALRVRVQGIAIVGASLLPETELQALVQELVGQSLTLAELEQAAQRIAEFYRARGWYARVYLPEQDLTDGRLRIQVLEGHFGKSQLNAPAEQRADGAYVQQLVSHGLQAGEPLSAAALERGLLLANDLPGIQAQGLLQAGQQRGQSDLLVSVHDQAFVTGDIGLNNHGVRATGRAQAVGGLALNNLSGQGDQLALRLLAAEGVRSALARYSLPLGYDGLRLALHGSVLGYELGGSYRPLDAEGHARTAGLTLSYPLIRQSQRNLSFSAGYENRRYRDDMLDASLRRHDINALTLGLTGDLSDAFGGVSWGSAQFIQGVLAIADVAGDRAQDAAGPHSQGSYSKLALQLGRLQALGWLGSGWQLQAGLSAQIASGNLASSERMTLGGPQQVRSYPVNEAVGDAGVLLKLELQRELGHGWQAVAFYDSGRIRQHHHPWTGWDGGSSQPNSYRLSGMGLGLNWRGTGSLRGWQFAASLATPVGSNPGSAQGRNGDGSRASSSRAWFSLNRIF